MSNTSTSPQCPHPEAPCCSPSAAWVWVNAVAELAVIYGDDDARRWLPVAISHALRMGQLAGVPR